MALFYTTANWESDYTDVSADGTAYHYSGVFLTVWKKQPKGSWKYVWD
jgi:ketosteroid isomerase-like protein